MRIECVGSAFVYRWPTGEIRLEPGQPVELPDDRALKLIAKMPGRVRIVEDQGKDIAIEPAHPYARLIYFEDAFGRILGPAIPEFLAKVGEEFWIVTTIDCQTRWIRSDRLRSQHAFDTQKPVIIAEPIREVK